jgi:hypothetical protein
MKPFKALLLTSLVLGACEKSNDVTQLHEEAVSVAKWYGPLVDDMAKRRDAIFQQGRSVPGNLPDVPEIVKLIGEAGEKINEMKAIAGAGSDGKSAMEKQADQLQKDAKPEELRKLIDENADKLDEAWTIANADLTHVEGWLWQYEQAHTHTGPLAVAPPQPTATNVGQPPPAAASIAAPEGAAPAQKAEAPNPGEPPAAPASPDDQAAEKAAGEKADNKAASKAGAGSAAEPKAATPTAAAPKAEPKAAAPKAGAGSAAAPKAAAPKAGAGSAAAPKAAAPKAGAGSAAK